MLLALAFVAASASAAGADAYLRVISQEAPVHSGPNGSYRTVYTAHRDEVFAVLERSTRDYWFKVELEDGTTGWILGDNITPFEVGAEETPGSIVAAGRAIKRTLLGPSPVTTGHVGLSFSAGILENEGVYILRPSWLIDSYWALEGFAGLSPRGDKDVFLGGFSFVLRMIPGAVIGPYFTLGVGAAYFRPRADNYVDPKETLMALGAGGGLEITFKKQITVRLDARDWVFFDENHSNRGQEYTGGLAIFF